MGILALLGVVFLPMVGETALSRRHERWLRRRGAFEPLDDVYGVMRVAYPAGFVLLALEGAWRGAPAPAWLAAGATVFALAKALKYAAIAALGNRWCFRVLVLPGAPVVTRGPYRALRHPNYVAVALEFLGVALMAPAPVVGVVVTGGFSYLLYRRAQIEGAALRAAAIEETIPSTRSMPPAS